MLIDLHTSDGKQQQVEDSNWYWSDCKATCRYRMSAPSCSRSYRMWYCCLYVGIGKANAVKVLSSGCQLLKIGNPDMTITDVLQEATQFVARCYGCATSESLSSARYEVWLSKTSVENDRCTQAKIPPSNVGSIWAKCATGTLPSVHLQRGLRKGLSWPATNRLRLGKEWNHEITATSNSSGLAEGVALAPPDVLKLTRCGCGTDQPCANVPVLRCTCATAQLSCTIFCGCHGIKECCNKWTKAVSTAEEDTDSDVDDNSNYSISDD